MSQKDAHAVIMAQADAIKRGALTIWTIYERPADHPGGFIARRFEVERKVTPTADVLKGDLIALRKIFHDAGLMKLTRDSRDQPQVVETWV
jgi:hypothetical protein